ncbi:hypothetical protein QA601_06285 [Chitinispirillales bacterium ANBcel5]|uniref:hypothetical protein n=1 Tax=Cellulosispirillum alkaliphilum TaxID=3039283 RepID=UPI002A555805|nr:hypothetical protein [Chitinispirillales bacterium ANBcel5]
MVNDRRGRGEIGDDELAPFKGYSEDTLIKMLYSSVAAKRTIASKLLSECGTERSVKALCDRLWVEKKLYTRIAVCESLVTLQDSAYPYLLEMLSTIGNNQQKEIPQKGFLKTSYPLPRDLAARTLCRFDKQYLGRFIDFAYQLQSLLALEQLIDVIGHMVYSHRVKMDSRKIIGLYSIHQTEMVKYKVIRSLSGLHDLGAKEFLYKNLNDPNRGIQFETVRSLILSGIGLEKDAEQLLVPEVRDFAAKLLIKCRYRL